MSDIMFSDGSIYAKSKINMINICLEAIGETPLTNNVDLTQIQVGTDADIASRIITRTMVEIQSQGWFFNMDYNFPLIPDTDNFISMPPNTLNIDVGTTENRYKYILKNGKIYDTEEMTFKIYNQIEADITWLVDYADLTTEAYSYISKSAARIFQEEVIGSTEAGAKLERNELMALTKLERIELAIQDNNIIDKRATTRIHSGYLQKGLYGVIKGRR